MKYYGVYTRKFDTDDGVEYRRCFDADDQLLLRFLHNWYSHKENWYGNERGYAFRAFFGTVAFNIDEMPVWILPEVILCDSQEVAACLYCHLDGLTDVTIDNTVITSVSLNGATVEFTYGKKGYHE